MQNSHLKKKIAASLMGLLGIVATGLSQAQQPEEQVLNFYNWSAYIADDTIANFEKETGIKVRYDTFDSSEILHAKLVAGRTGYDIVMSSTGWGRMQADGGLLRQLDKTKLPNLKNLDPIIQAKIAKLDPGNNYMVNWLWGYTTIGINATKVKAALGDMPMPENSWDLIFKPEYASKLKSCGISLLDSGSEVVPVALHYLGKRLDSTNPADYADVARLLASVRPYVTLFSSAGYVNDLISGSLCVSMGWSGDLARAQQTAIDLKTGQVVEPLLPKTGGILFFDTMVMPADAPHPDNAHKFMNYILRPEVHAALTNKVNYANPNKESGKFLKPEIAANKKIFPSPSDMERMGVQGAVNNELRRLMSRTFSKFKTGM